MVLTDITRKQAFLTHLAVSGSIFLLLSWLISFYWYPDFYFFSDGGDRAIVTIFFVDVVLGPGLTLLVFKPGKKSLKFDMSVILLMQFMALSWGIHNVYSKRPAASVYYQGSFTCISYPDARKMDLLAIVDGPSGNQRLAFLQRPDTVDELLDFTKEAYAHKSSSVYYYGDKVVPMDTKVIQRLDKYELDMKALKQQVPEFFQKLQQFVKDKQFDSRFHKLIPLHCRYAPLLTVLDTRQMRIVDWIDSPGYLVTKALDEPLPLRSQQQQHLMDEIIDKTFNVNPR